MKRVLNKTKYYLLVCAAFVAGIFHGKEASERILAKHKQQVGLKRREMIGDEIDLDEYEIQSFHN